MYPSGFPPGKEKGGPDADQGAGAGLTDRAGALIRISDRARASPQNRALRSGPSVRMKAACRPNPAQRLVPARFGLSFRVNCREYTGRTFGRKPRIMSASASTQPPAPAGRAYLFLTITALCWAANAIFGRLAVGEASPMAVVAFRWALVVALALVFARDHLKRDWPALKARKGWVIGSAVFGFALFNGLFYMAAHHTTAVNLGILQGSIPGIVMAGAFLMYRTPVTWLQILGVLITMGGVAIVATRGNLDQLAALAINPGDSLMFVACMLYAGYTVALRNRPPVSPLGLFALMAVVAFAASLPLAIIEMALGQFQWPTLFGWGVIVLVALFPSFLAQVTFMLGVGIIGPGRAGVFVNLVPVFAAVLAIVILREPFEGFHALAMGLVLGGIALAEKGKPAA